MKPKELVLFFLLFMALALLPSGFFLSVHGEIIIFGIFYTLSTETTQVYIGPTMTALDYLNWTLILTPSFYFLYRFRDGLDDSSSWTLASISIALTFLVGLMVDGEGFFQSDMIYPGRLTPIITMIPCITYLIIIPLILRFNHTGNFDSIESLEWNRYTIKQNFRKLLRYYWTSFLMIIGLVVPNILHLQIGSFDYRNFYVNVDGFSYIGSTGLYYQSQRITTGPQFAVEYIFGNLNVSDFFFHWLPAIFLIVQYLRYRENQISSKSLKLALAISLIPIAFQVYMFVLLVSGFSTVSFMAIPTPFLYLFLFIINKRISFGKAEQAEYIEGVSRKRDEKVNVPITYVIRSFLTRSRSENHEN